MSKRVLLIGCGQLGSRHLQALVRVPQVSEIVVVDPTPASLDLGRQRVSEIADRNQAIQFHWSTVLGPEARGADLCVIATQAEGRGALLKAAAESTACRSFLIEKVVAQSVFEYEEMLGLSKKIGLKVWVNCKTRAYSIHRYIRSKLDPSEPIVLTAIGGNHGLGTNGVHEADIFVYHDGCRELKLAGERIDKRLHTSKRGGHVQDLSGALFGVSEQGSEFVLSFSATHASPDLITITSSRARFLVDHFNKLAMESYPEDNWAWHPVRVDENWAVSHMTMGFASDILAKGQCLLPTLQDCFPAHKFILNALKPAFNQLRGNHDDVCPIT